MNPEDHKSGKTDLNRRRLVWLNTFAVRYESSSPTTSTTSESPSESSLLHLNILCLHVRVHWNQSTTHLIQSNLLRQRWGWNTKVGHKRHSSCRRRSSYSGCFWIVGFGSIPIGWARSLGCSWRRRMGIFCLETVYVLTIKNDQIGTMIVYAAIPTSTESFILKMQVNFWSGRTRRTHS